MSRIYFKFREEKDWKEFLNEDLFESTIDDESCSIAECRNSFGFELFDGGVRIGKNGMDCLIKDDQSDGSLKLFCETFAKLWVRDKGIILADNHRSSDDIYELYYLGGEIHECHRHEDADENTEIDITDCRRWLGEDRIYDLTYSERRLLNELDHTVKNEITDEEKTLLREIFEGEDKRTLRDIFPDLNKDADNGLVIEDGVCTDWNGDQEDYLGCTFSHENGIVTEDASWFVPAEVTEIGEDNDMFFGYVYEGFNTLVFTTNLRKIDPSGFRCRGFKHVYIIDAETEEVLFHSDKFYCDERSDLLAHDFLWNEFAKRYNEWPAEAMANPRFHDHEAAVYSEYIGWMDHLYRIKLK